MKRSGSDGWPCDSSQGPAPRPPGRSGHAPTRHAPARDVSLALLGIALLLPALLWAPGAAARPWIEPGDLRARHSVQWLVDTGCANLPQSTWPLMWAELATVLDGSETSAQCRDSDAWRYLRRERDYHAADWAKAEFRLGSAEREPLFRDFAGGTREKAEAGMRLEWVEGPLSAGLGVTVVHDPRDGDEVRLDGSYVAATLGNWVLGFGAIDRWWGPGWHSSTILSTNARPVPGFWLNRKTSQPFPWPVLNWLGPWQLTAFAGQLDSDRFIEEAKLLGARFSFRPHPQLEIGLSRTAQWGGKGREEDIDSLAECAAGTSNTDTLNDNPCNQLAGADARLALPVGDSVIGLYGELTGEDEAGGLPSRRVGMGGIDAATTWFGGSQQFYLEHANTTSGDLIGSDRANYAYEHGVYQSGYRFNGRNLASTWEGDSRVTTLSASHFFTDGSDLSLALSLAELNRDGTNRGRLPGAEPPLLAPVADQDIDILSIRYSRPLLDGRLTLSGFTTDDSIHTVERNWPRTTLSVGWEYRLD